VVGEECDACLYCNDTCSNVDCIACHKKRNTALADSPGPETSWLMGALSSICPKIDSPDNDHSRTYTMCQVRRHNRPDSAWILVGRDIYDATPYIRSHPGGMEAILRKSGGAADCAEDLRFHSKRAQREWRKFRVGTLCSCPRHPCSRSQ